MGRKAKLSKAKKIELIKRYKAGESATVLANLYGFSHKLIYTWHKKHEMLGEFAFDHSRKNKSYSKTFKEKVIKAYLEGEESLEDISNRYKISSHSLLLSWITKYNSRMEITDYDPKPEVYMAKSRKTTYEERLEIVKYCLGHEANYKETAINFGVNYAQVFSWVKKYKKQGEESLLDRRGKSKLESKMTDEEKLRHHLKTLEAKNAYLEMENKALKKLEEIERRVIREKHKK
jgi:transposase-like protein